MAKFKLGENATIFWDASQTAENQTLLKGEEKDLDITREVSIALQFGHIVLVEDSENEPEPKPEPEKVEPKKKK